MERFYLSIFLVGSCTVDRDILFLEVHSKGWGPWGTGCHKRHSSQILWKNNPPWGWLNIEAGCPEGLWNLHAFRAQMEGLWEIWSLKLYLSLRWALLWTRAWIRWRSLPAKMILWFYDRSSLGELQTPLRTRLQSVDTWDDKVTGHHWIM